MAKQRKSVFSADTSKQEVDQQAKDIERKVMKEKKPKSDERPKHLYVDSEHHRKAKMQAIQMGMKHGEYVEWLIDQHKP